MRFFQPLAALILLQVLSKLLDEMLPVLILISVRRQIVTYLVRTATAAPRRVIRIGMDDAMLLELQEEAVFFVEDDGFECFEAVKSAK